MIDKLGLAGRYVRISSGRVNEVGDVEMMASDAM